MPSLGEGTVLWYGMPDHIVGACHWCGIVTDGYPDEQAAAWWGTEHWLKHREESGECSA